MFQYVKNISGRCFKAGQLLCPEDIEETSVPPLEHYVSPIDESLNDDSRAYFLNECFRMFTRLCFTLRLHNYGILLTDYGLIVAVQIRYNDESFTCLVNYKDWDFGWNFNRYEQGEYLDKLYYRMKAKFGV